MVSILAKKKKPRRKKSLKQTATNLMSLAAFFMPEVAVLAAEGVNAQSAVKALSLKTGFDASTGTWNPALLVAGWGPTVGFEVGRKIPSLIRKFTSAI